MSAAGSAEDNDSAERPCLRKMVHDLAVGEYFGKSSREPDAWDPFWQ